MKKTTIKIIAIILLFSFLGGMLNAISYLENFNSLTLIQTGNLMKVFIYLIGGQYELCLYSLMIYGTFIVGLIIFKLLNTYIFSKSFLDANFLNSLILGLLLIPLIFFEFNGETVFCTPNIVNSISLSLTGSLIMISFSQVKDVKFSTIMITNDTKMIVDSSIDGIKEKNKEKIKLALFYFSIVLVFCVGVVSGSLIYTFVFDTLRERLMLLIIYIVIIIIIVLNFLIMKEKDKHE